VAATNAAADVLDALSEVLDDETKWPELRPAVTQAVLDYNNRAPKLFVCSLCFHKIDGPMIAQAAQPTPRLIHYPACPGDEPKDAGSFQSFSDEQVDA
jgi:hypothetical protein